MTAHRRTDAPARLLLAVVLSALPVIGCGERAPVEEQPDSSPAILKYDKDGLRYTYHVPTASESLFDLAADPRCLVNLAQQRPDVLERMRAELEAELGVESLDVMREDFSEHIERLRDLGYL